MLVGLGLCRRQLLHEHGGVRGVRRRVLPRLHVRHRRCRSVLVLTGLLVVYIVLQYVVEWFVFVSSLVRQCCLYVKTATQMIGWAVPPDWFAEWTIVLNSTVLARPRA